MNPPKVLTLCFILHEGLVLLGMKKRGFGQGKWNGFGGKLHDGETVESALYREVAEEVGLQMGAVEQRGFVRFEFSDGSDTHDVHIFACSDFTGEPQETEEMRPQWWPADALPFDAMWPGDLHWLPMFLTGQKFRGRFVYDRPSGGETTSQIVSQSLEAVEAL